ncbi:Spy0128 family protein [Muricomes intestini]|uniref:Spy0128 family protein n=1 Tax=Muricomes intestini TaxID=1796634 RepID=UPI002FDEF43B
MMRKRKRRAVISWIMTLLMMFSVLPMNIVHAENVGTDKTSVLIDITAAVSQNEAAITEGSTISRTEAVSIAVSFGIPVGGEDASPQALVKKGDTAAFHLATGFNLAAKTNIDLTTAGGLTIGHVSFAKDDSTGGITANVIFDGDDRAFDETQGNVTGGFHLNLTYDASGDSGSAGEHSVSILDKTYTVTIPEEKTEVEEQVKRSASVQAGGNDVTSLLTGVTASVKQEGNEVQPGDVLLDDKAIRVEVSFGVPVLGDGPGPHVEKGDYALILLSDALKVPSSTESIPLRNADGIVVGHIIFVEADGKVTARVDFDGADEVFDGTNEGVSAAFNAEFEFSEEGGESGLGDKIIAIVDHEYKLEKPPVETEYTLTKSGEVQPDQTVEWTVKVSGKKGTNDVDLAGYELRDDLTDVGDYVPDSFKLNGSSVAGPSVTDGKLSYTFPENSMGDQTVKFKTKIPDNKYFANGQQWINNKAELYDEDEYKTENSGNVTFTPEWIKKTGESNEDGSSGVYNPKDRTITWTITVNQMEAALKNPVLRDLLPEGLTLDKATVQYWDSTIDDWGSEQSITPVDSNYAIGNKTDGSGRILDTQALLTIVTKVPNGEYAADITTYTNTAYISWDGYTGEGEGISSGGFGVGIGYNAIEKSGTISDKDNQTITWTVTVDPKGQTIPEMKVYDLLLYGKSGSVKLEDLTIAGIDDKVKGRLTPQYNQRYAGSFSGAEAGLTEQVLPVMNGTEQVGELLVVTGFDTSKKTFTFDSIVTDPDIFAGNKSAEVLNTAALFSANTRLNGADAEVPYPSNMLKKELIKRGHTEDPAGGVNDILTNGDAGFDYEDKSAIFRISVNADGLDLTNATGKALGKVTVTDTLPAGWELAEILPGEDYLIFDGNKNVSGNSVTATDTTPDTVAGLDYTKTKNSITFTFENLNKPYVILVKAKPNAETLEKYFSKNGSYTATNSVKLTADNWETGIESTRKVTITSSLLSKTAALAEEGVVHWSVEYKPYKLENKYTKIEDTLPIGMELRTDASGNLILDGNITVTELTMKTDGSYEDGAAVTPVIGENVFYDRTTRVLTFMIPDSVKAYRFTYLTDVTGEPGTVTNQAKLYGESEVQESTGKNYQITDRDGRATMRRSGWIEIAKIDGATKAPLSGVEFTIFTLDGTTVIRQGRTEADGTLKLRGLPDGDYILMETDAPAGYTPDSREHSLSVVREDSATITCSIDGKTGDDANLVTIKNYQEGTAGELTLSKMVTGEAADKTKAFDFTITLKDVDGNAVNGTYSYIGKRVPAGDIEIKDGKGTISLTDGQSITIAGIPKGTGYTIKEADYSEEGYVSESTGSTGTIVEDETQKAAFTNTRVPASVVLEVQKVLDGKNLTEGAFSFELKDEEGNTIQTKTNALDGKITFDEISYDTVGEHRYTIQEVSGDEAGVIYDTNVISITVKVEVGEEGKLIATPVYNEGNQTFNNTYKPAEDSIILWAQKVLEGQNLNAGNFSFELKDQEGQVLQTKENDAQGKIYFDPIEYTKAGTYQYTIQEVPGDMTGITYDTHVVNVTVTVEDKDAQLSAAAVYEGGQTFTNTYKQLEKGKIDSPKKPNTGKKDTSKAKTPKTGDSHLPLMYGVILLISAGVLLTVLGIKRKRRS